MSISCPNIEANLVICACTSQTCERRGKCCECVRNHKAHGNLPSCLRPTETH